MGTVLRPLLLSLMLGLLEAIRQVDRRDSDRPNARWVLRVPLDSPSAHPERCWYWGESSLAN
ncbi:MAG TPA: hypothetical protein PKY96_07560 [Flavobacteriales bacterium]|nr:hypothetical protein [Flavobacteriales bacterium]